jgi:hypothetical protein
MDNKPAAREIQVYRPQPLAVTPIDPTPAFVRTLRLRGFGIWVRRWLRTAKPTEWITSTAQMMAVVVAITTGIIYLRTGALDSRKAAIDANISLLKIDERDLQGRIATLKYDEKRIEESKALLISGAAIARMHLESSRLGQMIANEEAASYRADLVQWAKELDAAGVFQTIENPTGVQQSIISKIAKYSVQEDFSRNGLQGLHYTIRRRPRRL